MFYMDDDNLNQPGEHNGGFCNIWETHATYVLAWWCMLYDFFLLTKPTIQSRFTKICIDIISL